MEKTKDYRRTRAYRALHADLIANLEARGLVEGIYRDKAEEYMDLWVRRKQLRDDIAERGLTIYDARTQRECENRSVSLEIQISRQMLAIYNALGFRENPGSGRAAEPEDEL